MNKYNIQAIRKELDDHIRNGRWKGFRSRFQNLNHDLAQSVVMLQQKKKHHQRQKPLLCHILCYSRRHPNKLPLPIDVLELIIKASPSTLHAINPTPLQIALEHSAPYAVLETLLLYDTTKQSLYIRDKKHGDTPLLYATKQEFDYGTIKLLIESDLQTRQSLLLCSKKRNRCPLFYFAKESLSYFRKDDEFDLPDDLQYMLLQTYIAVVEQDKSNNNHDEAKTTTSISNSVVKNNDKDHTGVISEEKEHDSNQPFFNYDYYVDDDDNDDFIDCSTNEHEHWTTLLEATIGTAHFLGTKTTGKLLSFLVPKVLISHSEKCIADATTTTNLWHRICNATEEQSFFEPNIMISSCLSSVLPSSSEPYSLIQVLLHAYPQGPCMPNEEGQLPVHLAIEHKKSWELLKHISSPMTAQISLNGSLPLHMAIQQYSNGTDYDKDKNVITELWKLHPEASSVVDGATGFFPFQLAALASENDSDGKSSSSSDNEIISRIYFLLRSAPQVLNQYIT